MSSSCIPVIFVIVSGWLLEVSDSFSTPVRTAREVQSARMEVGHSEIPTGEFHHGSLEAALAHSSLARHHQEGNLTLASGAAALASGTFGGMDGHLTREHNLNGRLGESHHAGGKLEANGQGSLSATGGAGMKAMSGQIDGHMGHGSGNFEASGLDKKAVALELLHHMSTHNSKAGGTAEIPSGAFHAHAIEGTSGQGGKLETSAFGGKRIDGHMGHASSTFEGSGLDKEAIALELLRHMSMHNSKAGGTAEIPSGALHTHAIEGLRGQGGKVETSQFGGKHIDVQGGLTGGIHGNTRAPQPDSSSSSISGHSISSPHSGAIGVSTAGREHLGGGQLHNPPTVPGGNIGVDAGGFGALMEMWSKIGGPEILGKLTALGENMHGTVPGGGQLHSPPTVPGGNIGVDAGGIGALMEMWSKIGGPEILGMITALGDNMHGAGSAAFPTSLPQSPPPGALSHRGTGTMGANSQSITAISTSRGGTGHIPNGGSGAIAYSGAVSNTSQPTELVYVMMMQGSGEMPKGTHPTGSVTATGGRNAVMGQLPLAYGRGGYAAYNTAGTYRMAQSAAIPATMTYTAIPVGSVATRGYSVQSRPMLYGGTARNGGSRYTAWPMTYGMGASRPYQMAAYNAIPVGQVVTTRAQQGALRPAGAAQTTYYTVQGGRTSATTQQRPAGGVTYAALPAVVMPAQAYKVASG